MATLLQQYKINGVLDTNNAVFENIEQLALSSGCWVTYDIHEGRWSVIINRAGTSSRSFDDSNIIGSININSTGLTEFYNGVKVTYAREDLNDQIDYVEARTPEFQRLANEPDNVLELTLPLVTDPVQALAIGSVELKQSRVNKVITFVTDYSAISANAGDLIDITADGLGWTNKVFRIITLRESDQDDGSIAIEITALEYDPDVYVNDLVKFERSVANEIVTIGDIGAPNAPGLSAVNRDNRPRLELSGVTPAGLVAGVEFWISRDDITYSLAGTERPAAGGVFAASTTVSLDVDNLQPGPVYVKLRAVNSQTSSPYSAVTSANYQPVQVTAAVDPNTAITDANGNLLTALAITELLKLIDGLKSDGDSGPGSLFEAIFEVFNDTTGVDIVNDIPTIAGDALDAFTTINVDNTDAGTVSTLRGNTAGFLNTVSIVGTEGVRTLGFDSTNDIFIAANPNRVEWATNREASATNGPWPSGLNFSGSNTTLEYAADRLYYVASANFGKSGAAQIDPYKGFRVTFFKNGSQVYQEGTSSDFQDAYDDLTLTGVIPNVTWAAGDVLRIDVLIDSEVATIVKANTQVFAFPDAEGV